MEDKTKPKPKSNIMEGRVIYVMVLVFLIQTLYPISFGSDVIRLISFQMLYLLMIVAGILVVQHSPHNVVILIGLGIFWAISGISYALFPGTLTFILAYASIGIYQGMVAWVLAIYIFKSNIVNRDVIYATIAVYLLIGAVFVGIFGIIEEVSVWQTGQHAFSDAQVGSTDVFLWQHLVYYSYSTLTTVGYGDCWLWRHHAYILMGTLIFFIGIDYWGFIHHRRHCATGRHVFSRGART